MRPWLFDVGSNIGVHTVAVGAAGFGVIAIEANPATAARLRCSIAANTLAPRVALLNVAVGGAGSPPHVCIEQKDSDNRGTAFVRGGSGPCAKGAAAVPTLVLDALFEALPAALPPPTVLKIDVEGFELFALRGGDSWLHRAPPPFVLIEVQPDLLARAGARFQDVITFWLERGYHGWVPAGGSRAPQPEIALADIETEERAGGLRSRMQRCGYTAIFSLAPELPVSTPKKLCG